MLTRGPHHLRSQHSRWDDKLQLEWPQLTNGRDYSNDTLAENYQWDAAGPSTFGFKREYMDIAWLDSKLGSLSSRVEQITASSNAYPYYDELTGSLCWTDEVPLHDLTDDLQVAYSMILRARTEIALGVAAENMLVVWDLAKKHMTKWIGLEQSRVSWSNELICFYADQKERNDSEIDKMILRNESDAANT